MNDKNDAILMIRGELERRIIIERDGAYLDNALDIDTVWQALLDDRESQEVDFSQVYANDFAHGTAGHNRLMLVAKLAQILDVYEETVDALLAYVQHNRTG